MEHDEARNLEIQTIDFTELKEGEFTGYYAGGMYQWRENECLVIAEYTSEYFGKTLPELWPRVFMAETKL